MESSEQYYIEQSPVTEPGEEAALFAELPGDLAALCEVVQGLLIHVLHGSRYGVSLPAERKGQVEIAAVSGMLKTIMADDPRPLVEARAPVERFVGTCRHYSVLLCSMLRHQGVPARVRNGFGVYLKPEQFIDHWVCEYWDAERGRWVAVDAQMDPEHRAILGIGFDFMDTPQEQLIPAGTVWRRCREGALDPTRCGALDLWGMDYVKANLLRDFLALNKCEVLPWDGAALTERPYGDLSGGEVALLDRIADLNAATVDVAAVRELYASRPELQAKRLPNCHELAPFQ